MLDYMESKDINLPLTNDEAGSLSLRLALIVKEDVFQLLEERKLTNRFDRQVLININRRLMQVAGEKLLGDPGGP